MCLIEGEFMKKRTLNSEKKKTVFQFGSFPERTCYQNGLNIRTSHRKVLKNLKMVNSLDLGTV